MYNSIDYLIKRVNPFNINNTDCYFVKDYSINETL